MKKKFDEIFAATRYTKALDNIKQIRKQLTVDLKIHDTNLKNETINKERAQKVSNDLQILRKQGDDIQARILELDGGKIDDLVAQMKFLIEKQQEFQLIQSKIDQCCLERDLITKNIESLSGSIQLLHDRDEALESKLQGYQQSIDQQSSQRQTIEGQKANLVDQIQKNNQELSVLFTQRGKFEAEKQAYDKLLVDCNVLCKELVSKYGLHGFDTINVNNIPILISKLKSEHAVKDQELNQIRLQLKEKENMLLNELQSLKSKASSNEETKRMTRKQIEAAQSKIKSNKEKIQDLEGSLQDLENTNEMIQQQEQDINTEMTKLKNAERDSSLPAMNRNLQELELKAQGLQNEIQALGYQVDSRARLSLKKQEHKRKSDALGRLTGTIQSECQSLFEFNIDSLENDLKKAHREKSVALKEVKDSHSQNSSKLSAIDSKIALVKTSLEAKQRECDLKKKKVESYNDFHTLKIQSQVNLEEQRANLSSMRSASSMYTKFISKFNSTKCCPLCTRGFSMTNEEEGFLQKLEMVLQRIPEATKAAETEYLNTQSLVDQLTEAQPIFDDLDRLGSEIQDLRQQISNFEREKSGVVSGVDDTASEIAILEVELAHVNNLMQRSTELLRLVKEAKSLGSDIKSLEEEFSTSGVRSFEEVNELLESTNLEIKTLRVKIERSVRETQIRQNGLAARQNKLRDLKDLVVKAQFTLEERERLSADVSDLLKEVSKWETNIIVQCFN